MRQVVQFGVICYRLSKQETSAFEKIIRLAVSTYDYDRQTDRQHANDGMIAYRLPRVAVLYSVAR